MKLIKSVRVRRQDINIGALDLRVSISEDKSTFSADEVLLQGEDVNNIAIWSPLRYKKSGIYKNYTSDMFINSYIELNNKLLKSTNKYYIVQDPWSIKVPIWRNYGTDPYYLNNGAVVYIEWVGAGNGIKWSDDNGRELKDSEVKEIDKNTIKKVVKISSTNESSQFTINKDNKFDYNINTNLKEESGLNDDLDILSNIIDKWKNIIPNYNLTLCNPNNISCSIIPYKSPLKPITPESEKLQSVLIDETKKTKINVSLPLDTKIRAKDDISIKIYIGNPSETNVNSEDISDSDEDFGLDDEFTESTFSGNDEAPIEIKEVSKEFDSVNDSSIVQSYTPPMVISGKVVNLPRDYSHTKAQGYNILNSQWIGDLVTSAKSHIGHPTYDIEGTEGGNLGCASAVSMIFYRAFGVNIRTGKPVVGNPTSVGSFGSKGTSELAGWFLNTSLFQQIPWRDAQPGDILNTPRDKSAGHIGIVSDGKNNDGSFAVISNSSKGFEGGGGGAIKQNYSVKLWEKVATRNPSKTFAYRYIGPKLSTRT